MTDKITEQEIILSDTIIELLTKKELKYTHYSERSKFRANDFSVEKIVKEWETIID